MLAATAHHEAGHAVAAVLKNVGFHQVSIVSEAGSAGHVKFLRPARKLEDVHKRGMIALAAEAAQRRFNPRSARRYHGSGDREAVVIYATDVTGSARQAQALLRLWEIQAQEFAEARWFQIQRVAGALLEHQTLLAAQARQLVFQGPTPPASN